MGDFFRDTVYMLAGSLPGNRRPVGGPLHQSRQISLAVSVMIVMGLLLTQIPQTFSVCSILKFSFPLPSNSLQVENATLSATMTNVGV